jgi:Ca2+-transporting ATPase
MRRPPRPAEEPLFTTRTLLAAMAQGASVLIVIAALYAGWQHAGIDPETARTMAFITLIGGNIGLMIANRSRAAPLARLLRVRNVPLYWVAGAAMVALGLTIYWPPLQHVFAFAAVGVGATLACFAAGLGAVALFELARRFAAPVGSKGSS